MSTIAKTNLEDLEKQQRAAARVITGCLRSTPVKDLTREANLLPFEFRRLEVTAKAAYRHLSHIPEDPLQEPLQSKLDAYMQPGIRSRQRLKRDRGWMKSAITTLAECGLADVEREGIQVVSSTPPWETPPNISISTNLCRPVSTKDPPEVRLAAAEDTLNQLPPADTIIYTDGSANNDDLTMTMTTTSTGPEQQRQQQPCA